MKKIRDFGFRPPILEVIWPILSGTSSDFRNSKSRNLIFSLNVELYVFWAVYSLIASIIWLFNCIFAKKCIFWSKMGQKRPLCRTVLDCNFFYKNIFLSSWKYAHSTFETNSRWLSLFASLWEVFKKLESSSHFAPKSHKMEKSRKKVRYSWNTPWKRLF